MSRAGNRFRGEALQDRELKKWRGKFANRLKMVKVEVLGKAAAGPREFHFSFWLFLSLRILVMLRPHFFIAASNMAFI